LAGHRNRTRRTDPGVGCGSAGKNYRDIIENKNPDYKRSRVITVINAKDVDKPEVLDDPRSCTWIKMTRPSFDAFRTAFRDPE
jgi:hypothetical protein